MESGSIRPSDASAAVSSSSGPGQNVWRESEFRPPLMPRTLLFLQDGRNYKNIEFTQVRYTAGTRNSLKIINRLPPSMIFLRVSKLPIVLVSFSEWSGHTIFVSLESDSEDAHFGVLHLLTFLLFFSQPILMLLFDVSGRDPTRHDIKLESRFSFADDYKAIEEGGVNQALMLFVHYPSALNRSVDL